MAGYQHHPDDLTIEEWEDLGSVEGLMKERSEMKLRDLLLEGICTAFNRGRM